MASPNSLESPVVSEAARRWVHGEMDSRSYFDEARKAAMGRARAEVMLRLHGNSRWAVAWRWQRIQVTRGRRLT